MVPARNEAGSIGGGVTGLAPLERAGKRLLEEVVVVDNNSTDAPGGSGRLLSRAGLRRGPADEDVERGRVSGAAWWRA